MFASFAIVFRESIEMLLISMLITISLQHIKGIKKYVVLGFTFGIFISIAISLLLSYSSSMISDEYQDVANIVVTFISIIFLFYAILFVDSKNIYQAKIQDAKNNIKEEGDLLSISVLVCFTVIREFVEILLFLAGVISNHSQNTIILGSVMGVVSAILLMFIIYRFSSFVKVQYIFKISNIFLIFICASLSSKLSILLSSCGIINFWQFQIWNTESFIGNMSSIGKILNFIIGYDSKPMFIQLIFYIVPILMFAYIKTSKKSC